MTAQHTPGPWKLTDGSSFVRDNHKNVIADVWQDSISNLRLIAAAPDLLDALREAVDMIDILAASCSDRVHNVSADKFRAAIAKAEGQQ